MTLSIQNCHGVKLQFSAIGATWLSCKLPLSHNHEREILLPCPSPHNNSAAFIGATIGRYANRIKEAVIQLDNRHYALNANQSIHQLHGGAGGFHTRTWQRLSHQTNRIIFGLISTDGDQGFPGQVKATVDYFITDHNQVMINYIATTDHTTPINLTNHAYFNLDGCGTILTHQLSVDADYYLPVDKHGIPLNGLVAVEDGMMDLRQPKPIGESLLSCPDRQRLGGYDHAYLLNHTDPKREKAVAKLISGDQKVKMTVCTNKPALQIYTGNHLAVVDTASHRLQNYQGIALETEFLPDSPNRHDWPHESSWFTAEQFYCYTTGYQFYF